MKPYPFLWLLLLPLLLLQQCKNSKHPLLKYNAKLGLYIYTPPNSLFQIGFPQKPQIKNIDDHNNPHNLLKQVATVLDVEDSTILSVDFEWYNNVYDTAAKDKVLAILKNEARLKGLPNAAVYYQPNELGDCYIIHGSKMVEAEDAKTSVEMMFDDAWYFKKDNLFCVSTISPISKYPNNTSIAFISSLKLVTP